MAHSKRDAGGGRRDSAADEFLGRPRSLHSRLCDDRDRRGRRRHLAPRPPRDDHGSTQTGRGGDDHLSDDDFELIDDKSKSSDNDNSNKNNATGVGLEEFKIDKGLESKSYKELVNGSLREELFSKVKFFHKFIN